MVDALTHSSVDVGVKGLPVTTVTLRSGARQAARSSPLNAWQVPGSTNGWVSPVACSTMRWESTPRATRYSATVLCAPQRQSCGPLLLDGVSSADDQDVARHLAYVRSDLVEHCSRLAVQGAAVGRIRYWQPSPPDQASPNRHCPVQPARMRRPPAQRTHLRSDRRRWPAGSRIPAVRWNPRWQHRSPNRPQAESTECRLDRRCRRERGSSEAGRDCRGEQCYGQRAFESRQIGAVEIARHCMSPGKSREAGNAPQPVSRCLRQVANAFNPVPAQLLLDFGDQPALHAVTSDQRCFDAAGIEKTLRERTSTLLEMIPTWTKAAAMAPLIATTLAMARDQMPHLPRRLMRRALALRCIGLLVLGLGGCGNTATLPVKAGIGPDPTLPPPVHTLLPTVNIAPAKGWPAGAAQLLRRAWR